MEKLYPTITRTPHWTVSDVREACIINDLYTRGTNEEYEKMFDIIRRCPEPGDIGIWRVAKDIAEHSVGQTVTNVMFILANEAVKYTFELDGDDNT